MTRHICNKRRNSLNDFSHLRIGSVQFFRNLRHFSIWREVKAASPADDLSAARRWSSLPFINHKSHAVDKKDKFKVSNFMQKFYSPFFIGLNSFWVKKNEFEPIKSGVNFARFLAASGDPMDKLIPHLGPNP